MSVLPSRLPRVCLAPLGATALFPPHHWCRTARPADIAPKRPLLPSCALWDDSDPRRPRLFLRPPAKPATRVDTPSSRDRASASPVLLALSMQGVAVSDRGFVSRVPRAHTPRKTELLHAFRVIPAPFQWRSVRGVTPHACLVPWAGTITPRVARPPASCAHWALMDPMTSNPIPWICACSAMPRLPVNPVLQADLELPCYLHLPVAGHWKTCVHHAPQVPTMQMKPAWIRPLVCLAQRAPGPT